MNPDTLEERSLPLLELALQYGFLLRFSKIYSTVPAVSIGGIAQISNNKMNLT
jgi:hypothetical protein